MKDEKDLHVEYSGLVYKDTAVDVMRDLVEERLERLDNQIDTSAVALVAVAKSEIKLMEQLKLDAESLKECTRYGAEHMTEQIKKTAWDKVLLNQQLLLQIVAKTDILCKDRAELQRILGKCSLACSAAGDDNYDYGED